jgi:iron complex outermembrane recepter protein
MYKKDAFLRYTCLATALASSFSVWAQTADTSTMTTFDPVVIIGVAPSSPLTFTTDPKIPRQSLPASDGTDYLKTIPGFSAIRNSGTNGDPVLRGMFGSRLNILTNGSSMPGACGSRMDAPSSYISPENFDQLTVIKGPQTVLWGPGASAGTIKFDRDTPRFTESGVRFNGSLTGGSFGRNDQAADLTVGNDKIYTRVTANHSHSQDYKDGDGNTVPSRWNKWNADLAVGFTPDADTLYELTAGTGDGEASYAGRGMDGSKFKRESLGLRFEKRHISTFLDKIEAQFYHNYADHVMDNFTLRAPRSISAMAVASNVDRATWGGRVAATLNVAEHVDLVSGMNFQQSRHRGRKGSNTMSYRHQTRVKDAEFSNTGVFSELTWHAASATRVIGGARLDWASAKDFRALTSMMPNPTQDERRTDTLPSGFLRYEHDLNDIPVTVYAGLGHVQRFPDYWELFSPRNGPSGSINPFRGIKPEKTTQLDIGAQYKTDTLEAWVSGYAGHVNDFILFNYTPTGPRTSISQVNNVNARIAGGELGASYKVAPSWTLGATLAYAWGQNRSDGRALPQIPPLETKLSAAYDDGVWSAGTLWRVVATQKRYALQEGNVVGKDFGPSAGFGIFSINGGYVVNKQVRVSLGIDNLFNKTYSEHLNLAGNAGFGFAANTPINEPGRTAWARVSVVY